MIFWDPLQTGKGSPWQDRGFQLSLSNRYDVARFTLSTTSGHYGYRPKEHTKLALGVVRERSRNINSLMFRPLMVNVLAGGHLVNRRDDREGVVHYTNGPADYAWRLFSLSGRIYETMKSGCSTQAEHSGACKILLC